MSVPTKIKPQPKYDASTHKCMPCTKCGGTGFYCMGTLDGQPYSYTGFACRPCGGRGWKLRVLPGKRAEVQAAKAALARTPTWKICGTHAFVEAAIGDKDTSQYRMEITYTD